MNSKVFQYPKTRHHRSLSPRTFKNYRTYKKYLQTEFYRVCVYCRQPDSSAPNLNFGVDHYKPKGLSKFAHLVCNYENLLYCCGGCNSRKNNAWPTNEKIGPYIVNPCDHIMNQHLYFDAGKGTVLTRSKYGEYTEELLQLNDKTLVEFRITTLLALKMADREIISLKAELRQFVDALTAGNITQQEFDDAAAENSEDSHKAEILIQNLTGTKPLPALRKQRMGVSLIAT